VTGFIQAAAFSIPLGQLKKLFGVKTESEGFIGKIVDICKGLDNANWYDFGVGMGSIAMLVLLKELKLRSANWNCAKNIIISKIIWFLGTAKAAIVTIVMMCIAVGIEDKDNVQLFLNGTCSPGTIVHNETESNLNGIDSNCTILTLTRIQDVEIPTFAPPLFGFSYDTADGEKYEVTFGDMIGALSAGLIIQPIISYLELISLGKSFAKKYQIDATQEMVALGASNLANSFVYGVFPVTAGMSRSAVNYQANAATQLSAWVTAGVMCLACYILAPIFVYIPSAALAAVIIVSASSLFNIADWKRIWTLNKIDMVPFVVTFVFSLRKSSTGLILGIITHLVILLGKFMMPVNRPQSKKNVIYLEGMCMYPSGDSLSEKLQKNASRLEDNEEFIIDFNAVLSMDAGAAFGIVDGLQFAIEGNKTLRVMIVGIQDEHIRMLKVCGLPKTISINGEAPEVDVIATSNRSSMRKNKIQPEDIESGIDETDLTTTPPSSTSRKSSVASL